MNKKRRLHLAVLSAAIVMSGNVAAASTSSFMGQSNALSDVTTHLRVSIDDENALALRNTGSTVFAGATRIVTSGRVPIPASGWLFASALAGMVAVSRRSKDGS